MKRAIILLAAVVTAGLARAQGTTGTVDLNGRVVPSVSLAFGGSNFSGVVLPGATEIAPAVDAALNYTANFGDISAPGVTGFQRVRLWLHLRTNVPYQVQASFADEVPAPGSVLASSSIGFAIKGVTWNQTSVHIAPRGPPVAGIPTGTPGARDLMNQTFFVPGINGNEPQPGTPSYVAALGMLSTDPAVPTPLLEGPRVSRGGGLLSTDNQLRLELEFAILPEPFLSPGTFRYRIDVTVVQP